MIEISKQQAYVLLRLLDDIMDIDSRSKCSDKFFRSHFMNRIKTANSTGIYAELKKALEGGLNEWN